MENVNQPRERQAPKGDPSTTEAQPDMPKRQEPERPPGHFKTAGSKERPTERADLSDELEHCRTQLRDYEQMLVARIGDADGDFRATTLRLQRVQRTQHDALDKRVQRHAWILGGLMLFAALCVIALFLVYRQSASESSRVAAEVSEIHRRLAGLSEEQGIRAQVRERPDQVATQIAAAAAASGGSDKGEEPTAQASSATTGQTPGKEPPGKEPPGEEAGGHLSGKTQHPEAEQKDRARDLIKAPQSAPQSTDAGSAPPQAVTSASTTDVSDGTDTTGQPPGKEPPGEEAGGHLSGETQHPDAEQKGRARDLIKAPQSAPQSTDSGSAPSQAVTSASTTDVSDGTDTTEQIAGEGDQDRLSGGAQHPDAKQKERAHNPSALQSTPQSTDTGSASPQAVTPASTTDASDGTDTTEQIAGEGDEDRLSGETQHPEAEQKDRARDLIKAPQSAPQFTDTGSAPPQAVASVSTMDVSDGTENASNTPEKREGNPPVVETARVNSPGAGISDATVVAGTNAAGTSNPGGKTHFVSKNGYGLQLIGFFNRKALDKFAARKELPAQVYVIRETYRGRPWQAIIHSLHPNHAAAREELARLPADLAALEPWIRSLRKGTKLQVIETGPE